MDRQVDAHGFVPVRIFLPPEAAISQGECVKLRVDPRCLRPLGQSASAPSLEVKPTLYSERGNHLAPWGKFTQQTQSVREELDSDGQKIVHPRLRKQLRAFENEARRTAGEATGLTSLHSTVSSTAFAAFGRRQIYPPCARRPPY